MKNFLKKAVSILIVAIVVFGVLPKIQASAAALVTLTNKEKVFIQAVLNGESSLNLSGYNMTENELAAVENKMFFLYPETNHYYKNCNYSHSGNKVTKINSFNYKNGYTKSSIKSSIETIERETAKILAGVNSNWSDLEIALYFHDYIAVNYIYDMDYYGISANANYTIYELLTEKKGVCQSYSLLYKYLLDICGVESYFVMSNEDNHSWNIVKIGGKWYHVDVTHDDPCLALNTSVKIDYHGNAEHNFFLLSDSQINNGYHDNWYNPIASKVTCYDYTGGELWLNADSAMVYEGGYWYYLDYEVGGLVRTSNFSTYSQVATLDKTWHCFGGNTRGYNGYFSGISAYNGKIFYNSEQYIFAYDIAEGKVYSIAGLSNLTNGSFFGFIMDGKDINLLITKDIYNNYTAGTFKLETYTICSDGHGDFAAWRNFGEGRIYDCKLCGAVFDCSNEILGDADGNGRVDVVDLAALKLTMAGIAGCSPLADMDKSGIVDTTDLASLKLKLAGVRY